MSVMPSSSSEMSRRDRASSAALADQPVREPHALRLGADRASRTLAGFQAYRSKCAQGVVGATKRRRNRPRRSSRRTGRGGHWRGPRPARRGPRRSRPERQRPDRIALGVPQACGLGEQPASFGIECRQLRPERHARRAGQGGEIEQQRRLARHRPPRARRRAPGALGIGVGDLDVSPLRLRSTSPGR
jgi:hypothetical protein